MGQIDIDEEIACEILQNWKKLQKYVWCVRIRRLL